MITFRVSAYINQDLKNHNGETIGQPIPEYKLLSGSEEFHHVDFGSISECENYISKLPNGWCGIIEVLDNGQICTYDEWIENELLFECFNCGSKYEGLQLCPTCDMCYKCGDHNYCNDEIPETANPI